MMNIQDKNGFYHNATDSEEQSNHLSPSGGGFYTIHVKGHLNSKWSDWLEGLEVKLLENGEMILSGYIIDQAALMGILNKLNRLNLRLLSVSEVNQIDFLEPNK